MLSAHSQRRLHQLWRLLPGTSRTAWAWRGCSPGSPAPTCRCRWARGTARRDGTSVGERQGGCIEHLTIEAWAQQRLAGDREHAYALQQCLAVDTAGRLPQRVGGEAKSSEQACPPACHTHQTVVSKHPLRAADGFAFVTELRRVDIASTCMGKAVWVQHMRSRMRTCDVMCPAPGLDCPCRGFQ